MSISQLRRISSYITLIPEGSTFLWLFQGTTLALFSFCTLVSGFQYFGEPIQCVQEQKDDDATINERVMNAFCFISSTYTVSKDGLGYGCHALAKYHEIPGVGPNPTQEKDIRKHSYYIWIPFILFFQSLTFLLPNSYWRYCEGGVIDKLISGVSGLDFSLSTDKTRKNIRDVAGYFHKRLKTHQFFAFAWIFRDLLALIVVCGNFFLTDSLLGGWSNVVFRFNPQEWNCRDPIGDAFPKVTKCTFHKFGAGGGLQNIDSLCVMALNVVNEKVYVILWFWFLILVPISFFSLLQKIGTYFCFKCLSRNKLMGLLQFYWIRLATEIPSFTPTTVLAVFADSFEPSDWIFFCQLIKKLSIATGKDFLYNVREFMQEERDFVEDSLV